MVHLAQLTSFTALLALSVLGGCRKEPALSKARKQTSASPNGSAPLAAASVASAAAAPSPTATATASSKPRWVPSAERAPVALDEAAQRTAKQYLAALSGGRKATVAKDFSAADSYFSKCLALVPGDPRALGERGYARLLAGNLPEADSDLAAAAKSAPNSTLMLQILHNRTLLARQRGDEKAAAGYEKDKNQLKAARRVTGVTCRTERSDSDLKPERPQSVDDALARIVAAHAKQAEIGPAEVSFSADTSTHDISDIELKKLASRGTLPDSTWTLTTDGKDLMTTANHVLIAHAGNLYLYPDISFGSASRCGRDGLADLSVGGGVVEPWHITLTGTQYASAYMCEWGDHTFSPCADDKGDGTPVQTYCAWTSTNAQLVVLDAKTMEGLLKFEVSVEPSTNGPSGEPSPIMDLEWQAEQVAVTACGTRELVPYAR